MCVQNIYIYIYRERERPTYIHIYIIKKRNRSRRGPGPRCGPREPKIRRDRTILFGFAGLSVPEARAEGLLQPRRTARSHDVSGGSPPILGPRGPPYGTPGPPGPDGASILNADLVVPVGL